MDVMAVFWRLLFAVVCCVQYSVQNCAELELLGIEPAQKLIKVQQDSVLNLTFSLITQRCGLNLNPFMVTLSSNKNGLGLPVVICKVRLHNESCQVTELSYACVCVNDDTVQFLKRVAPEDTGIFTWKWSSPKSLREEKQREITLIVECKCKRSNFELTLSMIIAWSCVICIFIACAICCIRRMWRFRAYRMGRQEEKILYVYKALNRQTGGCREEAKGRNGNSRDITESSRSPDATSGTDGYLEPKQIMSAVLGGEEGCQSSEEASRL